MILVHPLDCDCLVVAEREIHYLTDPPTEGT